MSHMPISLMLLETEIRGSLGLAGHHYICPQVQGETLSQRNMVECNREGCPVSPSDLCVHTCTYTTHYVS
jgi:hypothetical protein